MLKGEGERGRERERGEEERRRGREKERKGEEREIFFGSFFFSCVIKYFFEQTLDHNHYSI